MQSAQCPKCGKTVSTTHRMQTIQAQIVAHLRSHGLTIKESRIEFYKIKREDIKDNVQNLRK